LKDSIWIGVVADTVSIGDVMSTVDGRFAMFMFKSRGKREKEDTSVWRWAVNVRPLYFDWVVLDTHIKTVHHAHSKTAYEVQEAGTIIPSTAFGGKRRKNSIPFRVLHYLLNKYKTKTNSPKLPNRNQLQEKKHTNRAVKAFPLQCRISYTNPIHYDKNVVASTPNKASPTLHSIDPAPA
jgi:hypothetical protein